ncbi:hypothetical protein PG999_010224 [Apiospora kogelbergensis]|uniref:Dockerin type 1 n=1 Tax=Apiospora kogelbergensis TaxID=1337665 RepID=A0AAW0Q9E9_9PEZI
MLPEPTVSVLGTDPSWRKHILNGNAFQQDALQSFNGWQYACFYSARSELSDREPLFVHLSRRKLPVGRWETLVFEDYPQTTDDGHNTAQLGICPGDGTIHLSYDHHCDPLRYRHSIPNLATAPESYAWSADHFTPTSPHLPGLASSPAHAELLRDITYPRFGQLGRDLWFSFRTGKAGLGDDHLYLYSSRRGAYSSFSQPSAADDDDDAGAKTTTTTAVTPFLKGVRNNPYIHGLDARAGSLYVTWVYRDFVWYDGWDDPADTQHKQQAGPNSAANNRDLCFAYSTPSSPSTPASTNAKEPAGRVWRNGAGAAVADLARGESVAPASRGVTALRIPRGAGLTNQEAQAVDRAGACQSYPDADAEVEEKNEGGGNGNQEVKWKHYYRDPATRAWRARPLPCGYVSGKRGRLAVGGDDDLYFVLPGEEGGLRIWRAGGREAYGAYELVWSSGGSSSSGEEMFPLTEPLVDTYRLDHDNVLSVFARRYAPPDAEAPRGSRAERGDDRAERRIDVVVLDFQL